MRRIIFQLLFLLPPLLVLGQSANDAQKQIAEYDNLMTSAKTAFKEKKYAESTQYYKELIALLEHDGQATTLVPRLKEQIVINNMYLASPYLKSKEYAKAADLYLASFPLCTEGSKVYKQLSSSTGTCFSIMSLQYEQNNDLKTALEYCEKAEKYYSNAGKTDKVLGQRISHADILVSDGKYQDARKILNEVIASCATNLEYAQLHAKALCVLADAEYKLEDFQNAIAHAEKAYNMSKDRKRQTAHISAGILWRIYNSSIPDTDKAVFWKNIYDSTKE